MNKGITTALESRAMKAYLLLVQAGNKGLTTRQLARKLKVKESLIQTTISQVRKHGHTVRKIEGGAFYLPDAEEMDRFARRHEAWT